MGTSAASEPLNFFIIVIYAQFSLLCSIKLSINFLQPIFLNRSTRDTFVL